jgi:flagellar biosynthesis GTPase FlhF
MSPMMPSRHTSCLMRWPIMLLLALATAATYGQGKFTVNGRLKIEGGDLASTRVVVYRNGVKERSISANLNKFSLVLELNANYVLSFEKDGFVSKKLQFDTRLPAGTIARDYTPFEFAVSLFKQYDDVNIVVFNQPVGMIRYEASAGDFDYDTDYTKSIQSQLQQALAEVEAKQKEEERNAGAEAKRLAAEEKLKAKAEAEAAKQAEAEAKAEQARADAQRKEEERRKAEAQKAEQALAAAAAVPPPAPPAPAPKPAAPPPPPPVVKPAPAPPPVQRAVAERPRPTSSNATSAKANTGQDDRRAISPVMVEERSPVAKAKVTMGEDLPVVPVAEDLEPVRQEELIIEPNKVMTIVRLEQGAVHTEYKKVIHKWGTTYYFKNGEVCTQQIYDREAMGDRLVDAAPRGKMD